MPFTLAHPIAVAPIWYASQRRLDLSALVVGAMIPDISYFVALRPRANIGHSPLGVLVQGIPAGLLLLLLFYGIMAHPLRLLLPKTLVRYVPPPGTYTFWPWVRLALLSGSIALGAFSHILWDAFTHSHGWFVVHWAGLQHELWGYLPVYKFLQYSGGLLGLAGVMTWVWVSLGRPGWETFILKASTAKASTAKVSTPKTHADRTQSSPQRPRRISPRLSPSHPSSSHQPSSHQPSSNRMPPKTSRTADIRLQRSLLRRDRPKPPHHSSPRPLPPPPPPPPPLPTPPLSTPVGSTSLLTTAFTVAADRLELPRWARWVAWASIAWVILLFAVAAIPVGPNLSFSVLVVQVIVGSISGAFVGMLGYAIAFWYWCGKVAD